MIRLVITGVAGRMGDEIRRAAGLVEGIGVVGGTIRDESERPSLPPLLEFPVETSLGAALAHGADVVVDFTAPQAGVDHVAICAERGIPYVSGITGFSADEQEALAAAAEKIPVLHAPNMSVGVNLLLRLVTQAAQSLGDAYDVEIVEAHHRHKRDSPSGTALRLAETAAEALGRDVAEVSRTGRDGMVGPRDPKEIGVFAMRGGDVVGDHTVYFLGEGERIELTHRASSRGAFAQGAVRAAKWIVGKPAGLYGMQDVLG